MPVPRRALYILVLLAGAATACPTTFGKGGKIDQAILKDIYRNMRRQDCSLSEEEFLVRCREPTSATCPGKCRVYLEDYNE